MSGLKTIDPLAREQSLREACRNKNNREVKALLSYKVDPDCPNTEGAAPLAIAVQMKDYKTAKTLIEAGADASRIGLKDKSLPPISEAIVIGNMKIFQLLVNSEHVNVDVAAVAPGQEGFTPLHFAAMKDEFDMLKVLLDKNAEPFAADTSRKSLPLHLAAMYGASEQIFRALVNRMTVKKIDQADALGYTALHVAAREDKVGAATVLLQLGASAATQVLKRLSTPLHIAAEKGHYKIVASILAVKKKCGADTEMVDKDGNTPLHLACASGHVRAALELIKAGANAANPRKKDNLSPVHLALQLHKDAFTEKFRKHAKSSKKFADILAQSEKEMGLTSSVAGPVPPPDPVDPVDPKDTLQKPPPPPQKTPEELLSLEIDQLTEFAANAPTPEQAAQAFSLRASKILLLDALVTLRSIPQLPNPAAARKVLEIGAAFLVQVTQVTPESEYRGFIETLFNLKSQAIGLIDQTFSGLPPIDVAPVEELAARRALVQSLFDTVPIDLEPLKQVLREEFAKLEQMIAGAAAPAPAVVPVPVHPDPVAVPHVKIPEAKHLPQSDSPLTTPREIEGADGRFCELYVAEFPHEPEEITEVRLVEGRTYVAVRESKHWVALLWGAHEYWAPRCCLKPLPIDRPAIVDFKRSELLIHEEDVKITTFRGRVVSINENTVKGDYHSTPVIIKKVNVPRNNHHDKSTSIIVANTEIEIMSSLAHDHILPLQGWYQNSEGHFFLVTPRMKHGDLMHYLETNSDAINWDNFGRFIAHDIAGALGYLHTMDPPVIHGDIKSPNILLDDGKDRIIGVLGDFGSAEIGEPVAKRVRKTVSKLWSAPELKRGEVYTSAVDIFSFGVVLWELFTAKRPWADDPSLADGDNPYLDIPVQCPPYLAALIQQCMSPEPHQRPPASKIIQVLKNQSAVGILY